MKILRKIIVFILGFLLVNVICSIFLSYHIKDIVQDKLIGGVVKDSFVPVISDNSNLTKEQKEAVSEIVDTEEFDELVGNIVDNILGGMSGDEVEFSSEDLKSIFDYIIDNKEELEKITGEEIDVSGLNEFMESEEFEDLNETLVESINTSGNELSSEQKDMIKLYTDFTGSGFRTNMLFVAGALILLIMLVQWSLYKWIKILGRSLFTTGITLCALCLLISVFIERLFASNGFAFNINISSLLYSGIACIVFGLLLIVIFKIIENIIKINKDKGAELNEVS